MGIDFENSLRGSVDISGQPDPVRTPRQLRGDTRRRIQQSERRPQAQGGGGGLGGFFSGLGSKAHELAGDVDEWRQEHNLPAVERGDYNPIDWAKEDTSTVWRFAQDRFHDYRAFTDPGNISNFVQQNWNMDDAKVRNQSLWQRALDDAVHFTVKHNARLFTEGPLGAPVAQQFEARGRPIPGEKEAVSGVAGQEVSAELNPLTFIAPEQKLAQMAAFVGIPAAEAALSRDRDESLMDLAWAGITAATFGRVPRPLRQLLSDHFGGWGGVEKAVTEGKDAREKAAGLIADPAKHDQHIADHVQQQLSAADQEPITATPNRSGLQNLVKKMPGEPDLRDPSGPMKELDKEGAALADAHLAALSDVVEETGAGLWATHENPVEQIWQSIRGQARSGDAAAAHFLETRDRLLGKTVDVPLASGYVRLYRAAHPEAVGKKPLPDWIREGLKESGATEAAGRWFTEHPEEVAWYEQHEGPRKRVYVDVPKDVAEQYRVSNLKAEGKVDPTQFSARPDREHFLPSEIARQAKDWPTTTKAIAKARSVAMMKAGEGNLEAYAELSPQERIVVDANRVWTAALREAAGGTDYAEHHVPNYVPRLDEDIPEARGRGRPTKASVMAREVRRHRAAEEQLDPASGRVILGQKYPTVQSANAALRQARGEMTGHLLDVETPLQRGLDRNPEAQAIRNLAKTDMAAAQHRAGLLAADHYRLKSEDFLENTRRVLPKQLKAINTQKGLNVLGQTIIRAKRPDGTEALRAAAANIGKMDQRGIEELRGLGYQSIDDSRFRNWVFDPEIAGLIKRAMGTDFNLPGAGEAVAKLNHQLVRLTMFSPHIHGANIARRMGALSMNHPIEFTRFLKEHGPLVPAQMDDARRKLRREAWQWGLKPPQRGKGWQSGFTDLASSAFGDEGDHLHEGPEAAGKLRSMLSTLAKPYHGYESYEAGFWRWVNDFGVMATHVEYEALKHSGKTEAEARTLAARRGNSWMGMVLPEDTNPFAQKIMKMAIFAPNWWRTMGELMMPIYRRTGLYADRPEMVKQIALSGLKTVAAMYAFQKLSTQAMNLLLSGHMSSENEFGHQDDVEIRNPAILQTLNRGGLLPKGIDPNTGLNTQTGGKMYLSIGGQFENVLRALGYESRQAGQRVGPQVKAGPMDLQLSLPAAHEDVEDGAIKVLAAILSPFMHDVPALLGNFDLYASMTQRTPRALVPGTEAGRPTPLSVIDALIQAAPGGLGFRQAIDTHIRNGTGDTQSLFGTKVPTSVADYLNDFKIGGERAALSGLLGVNAPYQAAQRSRGQPVSDANYQTAKKLTDDYNKQQLVASAEASTGKISPAKWRQQYSDASKAHSEQMRALFHDAPQYVNGSQGMANQWESLYEKATGPDGTVDHTKLSELQAQFRSEHTPEEMAGMNSVLRQNRDRTPMLKFYHHILDSYSKWQEDYAAKQGVDVTTLRGEISAYNSMHGDSQAQREYLAKHPELRRYNTAVKTQFDRTNDGLFYTLFHGNSRRAMQLLKARHLDVQSEVQAESAA